MDIFKYYSLASYQQRLQNSNIVLDDYKSFDKKQEDKIHYIIFDIKSHLEEKGIIISYIKYLDNLEFTYDIFNNTIIIHKLPIMNYDNDNISVFTTDILEVIKKSINKYTTLENVKVVLNPLSLFAYSNDVISLIDGSENFKLINKIVNRTNIVRESLKRKIINEKRKLDELDKKRERVLEKRKETFGIKKEDYKTVEEYTKALNERIVEYAKKQLERYNRQLNICKLKYTNQLKKVFNDNMDFFLGEYMQFIEEQDNMLEEMEFLDEISPELIDSYIEKIVDLEVEIISKIREDIDADWKGEAKDSVDIRLSRRGYEYTYGFSRDLANSHFINDKFVNLSYHPIYESEDKKYIFKMINLALYIYDLKKKIEYYQNIVANPNTACLEYEKDNILWGNILELPYFFKIAQDNFQNSNDRFNLLMIKPGTSNIDLDNFVILSKYKKEGFREIGNNTKTVKYEYHKNKVREIIENKEYTSKRLIITIPESLEYKEVKKLIVFGINYGFNINFVCETMNTYLNVKRIIILEEILKQREGDTFIGRNGNIFVNVDPYYYQMYFTNLPSNKSFWHMYDYSSNYQYCRSDVNSLSSLIHNCINTNYDKNNGKVDYEEIEEWLLGSYGSLKFDKFEVDNYCAIDTFDRLWYQPFNELHVEKDIFDLDLEGLEEKEQILKRVVEIRKTNN